MTKKNLCLYFFFLFKRNYEPLNLIIPISFCLGASDVNLECRKLWFFVSYQCNKFCSDFMSLVQNFRVFRCVQSSCKSVCRKLNWEPQIYLLNIEYCTLKFRPTRQTIAPRGYLLGVSIMSLTSTILMEF